MRHPDSLNVGEPGRRENLEHQHPNRSSTHFASNPLFHAAVAAMRKNSGDAS